MAKTSGELSHYKTLLQGDVPRGRNGKHKKIVTHIMCELERLQDGSALRIPLQDLADTKENIRSALNRASRKADRKVATAADNDFLYVWNKR